jgi:large subunit ribosomal protein L31e
MMGTKDVRLETDVNKALWKNGIHNTPNRIRVRLARKRNEDEEAKEKVRQFISSAFDEC